MPLKDTPLERKGMPGCLGFTLIGAVGGGITGWLWGSKQAAAYNAPKAIIGFLAVFLFSLSGIVLGTVIYYIWDKLAKRKELKEEEF